MATDATARRVAVSAPPTAARGAACGRSGPSCGASRSGPPRRRSSPCSCSRRSSPTCWRPTIRSRRSRRSAWPPSWQHPFGTDDIGRDVLSRIIYGARISLWVGLLAVGIGTVAGMIIGLLCGYCEGRLDLVMQRVMDAIQAIPGLVLALAIVSVLKPNTTNAMLAIAMVIIPGNSRIVRGAVLSAKQNRYVEAAQAIGCRHPRIIAEPHPART